MEDLPFISESMLRDVDPGLFTSCGRALYVAQHFEKNLKGFLAGIDLLATHIKGDLNISDHNTINALHEKKLKRSLKECISKGFAGYLPDDLKDVFNEWALPQLNAAREARNRIAHDFLFGIEDIESGSEYLKTLLNRFRQDVTQLAEADHGMCCIFQGFNRELAACDRQSYVDYVVNWVLEPIAELMEELGQQ